MHILGPLDYEQHREFLLPIISKVNFFAQLSAEQLDKLLYFIKFVEFEEGEVVFEKDSEGDSFFLIYKGRVQAQVPGLFGSKVLNSMGPGDFFGELALMLKQPRAADIVCTERTRCFMLDKADFTLLLERNPDIDHIVREVARQRFGKY